MKKVIIGSLLVVGLAAGAAWGHGKGYGRGGGHHMMGQGGCIGGGYNQEMMGPGMGKRGGMGNKFEGGRLTYTQKKEFLDATVTLRKQMHDKRFDYREAARNESTTPAQLADLEKQIIDLRAQIQEQRLKFLQQPQQ